MKKILTIMALLVVGGGGFVQRIWTGEGSAEGNALGSTLGRVCPVCADWLTTHPSRDRLALRATPCSTYAGHPSDLGRVVEGVADDKIVPGLAIPACQEEVERDRSDARLIFQLGRALKAGRREEEATKHFRQAYQRGFCGAGFYLARVKMREYWGSADNRVRNWTAIEDAKALLSKEGECFDPAQELLGQLQHDPADFAAPKVIGALWDGRIQDLNQNRIAVAVYLEGFQHGVNEAVNPNFDAECPSALVQNIDAKLAAAVRGDAESEVEGLAYRGMFFLGGYLWKLLDITYFGDMEKWKEYVSGLGRKDANRLIHHNKCSSPVMDKLYLAAVLFADTPVPLRHYASGLKSNKAALDLIPLTPQIERWKAKL